MFQVFKGFLKHEQAWDLACSIDGTPSHWWSHVVKHSDTKDPIYTQSNVGGYRQRFVEDFKLRQSVQQSGFSYKFHRTTPHKVGCTCWECSFKKDILDNQKFKDFLIKNTSLQNPVLYESFTSAYPYLFTT